MSTIQLEVSQRSELRKNQVKKLRAADKIPGVVYGQKKDPVQVTVDRRALEQSFKNPNGINTIVEITLDGKKEPVMAYNISKDAITQRIIHVDFIRIDEKTAVRVDVPLEVEGTAPGVKMGGMLLHRLRRIVLKCLPKDIPSIIKVNVSNLKLDTYFQVKDLPTEDGKFEYVTNSTDIVLQVVAPRKAEIVGEDAEGEEGEASAEATDGDS